MLKISGKNTLQAKFTQESGQKKQELTISDLTGIWVAVYTFAVAGLIAKALKTKFSQKGTEHKLKWVDQWGNALPNPKALQALSDGGTRIPFTLDPRLNLLADQCDENNNRDSD